MRCFVSMGRHAKTTARRFGRYKRSYYLYLLYVILLVEYTDQSEIV